jgi:RNA polymerase sigma factor (sigma-70 family)
VSLFRGGSEEAFRAIHDRYRQRMFAYTRQMLTGSAVDAEDAVQEIFVRAYSGLRSSDRELALRAWLYRIAHNRCIDELRRPQSVATEAIPATVPNAGGDPVVRLEQRDALKRLIADVQRLPDQQRSALLMRELAGMSYADVAGALGVSVPAVKSLLVRARVGLAQANEARDTACARIREDLIVAHDRGVRASGLARRHLRDCPHCRQFRGEVRGVSRQLAGFVPALGPIGVIAKVLGIGGGGGAAAGTSAIAGSGATATAAATATTAAGGLAGAGGAVGLGALAGTGHVVTLLAAAVVTAGGAIELQHISPPAPQRVHHHHAAPRAPSRTPQAGSSSATTSPPAQSSSVSQTSSAPATSSAAPVSTSAASNPLSPTGSSTRTAHRHTRSSVKAAPFAPPLTETLDPDQLSTLYGPGTPPSLTDPANPAPVTSTPVSTPGADGTSSATPTDPTAPTGTSSSTPVGTVPTSTSGTASTGTTGTGTATSGTTGPSGTSNTPTISSSTGGSSTGTGSTGGGGSATKVTSAASTGSIDPSKIPAASRPHGHGTIAVFTMTGN